MNNLKLNLRYSNNTPTIDRINKKYYSLSANFIRQTFIDYFSKENHSYIKSSPVRPFNDPTLEFVNAGMNQFKNIFLGYEGIPVSRAVNSQKCIRVGGKHNDLDSVGKDTYHHTFFEMLGNWSFNDYFKKDACKFAWDLITSKPYALDPNRLYVTYFKGDDKLNLPPDIETKEIWEEIGVARNRILPFGLKENFWEMGLTGPCGPCTEIHYDHFGTNCRPHLVNKDSSDLTELWNNVFIQFNRLEDGSLRRLEKHFVDTGMGLERLVALLQGKSSNYDTDIFAPYFSAISKISGHPQYSGKFGVADEKGLDTAYRILADHSRMISVAIADNVFPDESHGLRRVIRKGLLMSEKVLPGKGVSLLVELSKIAGETFSCIFPEVANHSRQIEFILRDENELWELIKSKTKTEWENIKKENEHLDSLSDVQSTGLISSFKELKRRKIPINSVLPGDLCLILYDRYGLNPQVIEELARVCGYSVNIPQLQKDILVLRESNKAFLHSSKQLYLPRNTLDYIANTFCQTDDSFKTTYFKKSNDYCFDKLRSKVQAIVNDGQCISNVSSLTNPGITVSILLEKTNLWSSLKGGGDKGEIKLFDEANNKIGKIDVEKVLNIGGYIYHVGKVQMSLVNADIPIETLFAEVTVNNKTRMDLMRNTSAAHLLSLALQEKFICNLQSNKISDQEFSVNFLIYGHLLCDNEIKSLEERINSLINAELDISITRKSTNDLVGTRDFYLPSYINPNMKFIHLIDVSLDSGKSFTEVTVGPNVLNTKDIGHVCFLNCENKNRGRNLMISGISGSKVKTARKNVKAMLLSVTNEEMDAKTKLAKLNSFICENPIPLDLKSDLSVKLQEVKLQVKQIHKDEKANFIQKAIIEAKEKCEEYLVLYVGKETKLERLTQLSFDLPIMLFTCNGNYFSARCHVPEDSPLRAADWMATVANKLGGQCVASKDQDSSVFLMRPIKVQKTELKYMVEKSEAIAKSEANALLSKNKKLFDHDG